jgi:hypothetical protein
VPLCRCRRFLVVFVGEANVTTYSSVEQEAASEQIRAVEGLKHQRNHIVESHTAANVDETKKHCAAGNDEDGGYRNLGRRIDLSTFSK